MLKWLMDRLIKVSGKMGYFMDLESISGLTILLIKVILFKVSKMAKGSIRPKMDKFLKVPGKEGREMAKENSIKIARQLKAIGRMTNFHVWPELHLNRLS